MNPEAETADASAVVCMAELGLPLSCLQKHLRNCKEGSPDRELTLPLPICYRLLIAYCLRARNCVILSTLILVSDCLRIFKRLQYLFAV